MIHKNISYSASCDFCKWKSHLEQKKYKDLITNLKKDGWRTFKENKKMKWICPTCINKNANPVNKNNHFIPLAYINNYIDDYRYRTCYDEFFNLTLPKNYVYGQF